METWFLIVSSICISVFLKTVVYLLFPNKNLRPELPPGPPTFPIIGNALWLCKSVSDLEPILRDLHTKYGNMVTLRRGSRPSVFIRDHSLAHQALVQKGSVFADRPPAVGFQKVHSSNQYTILYAGYGPIWRILRKNLTSEILSPARVKSYSHARKWVSTVLKEQLMIKSQSTSETVRVLEHLKYAMFCLLALMCFGDKLGEHEIRKIEEAQHLMLSNFGSFSILRFWPRVTKVLFFKLWRKFMRIHKMQGDVLIPLIRARKMEKEKSLSKVKHDNDRKEQDGFILSYVDTLLELRLPDENNRRLTEGEMVALCFEFIQAGTDTTAVALQWIMANLVKNPHIQDKLFAEIEGVIGSEEEIKEDDLQKMPYLKAVVLESLRRHAPIHVMFPHRVTKDVIFNDFLMPKNGNIYFEVGEMGLNPNVWEDPMAFKPERFLSGEEVFDIACSKEIKMMPFGAGRRICPGWNLAMLHLEYFVANLVWSFEWKAVEGGDIDLSELIMGMKTPLQAHIYSRPR